MRLGINSQDEYILLLNNKNKEIQEEFQKRISEITINSPIKVMLGDSTVTAQQTFDPAGVTKFFEKIVKELSEFTTDGVSQTSDNDLQRIFVKFEIKEGNYILSFHLSLQFRALLFYRLDNQVIKLQKELAKILDELKKTENNFFENAEKITQKKLDEAGYKNVDHQNLFEIYYKNNELREKIFEEINKNSNLEYETFSKRRDNVLKELDNLLIETYQTTSVLIDDNRLISGEEGCLCNIDLEFVKKNIKEGIFDPKKIPLAIKKTLVNRLEQIQNSMKT